MRNIITIIVCLTALSLSSFAQNSRDYIRKGNRLMRDSAYAKAQVQYQKAVEADNADSRAHYNLGNAMSLQSKAEDAMKEYQTAVKLEKNKNRLAQMYHNMGVIMQSAKQPDKALEFYKQSLRNNPHSEQTRYNYALCLHQLKKGGQDNQDQQQDENGQDEKKKQEQQQQKDKQDKKNDKKDQQKQQPDPQQMSKENAEQMLKAANLNVQFSGSSEGKVVAQSVTAGGTAAYGTVITLTTDSGEDTAAAEPVQDDGTIDPANEAG